MPNPEKWEEISFDEIKKGDEVRTIITDKGGFHSDTRGVANVLKSGYPGERWLQSEQGWYVARKKGTDTSVSTFYRKKPPPFVLPTKPLAVVEVYNRMVGRRVKLYRPAPSANVKDYWYPVHAEGLSNRYTEEYILSWSDLKILHEGVDL